MSILDPLDRPIAQTSLPPAPQPRGSAVRWVVVGLCALAAGAALTFWWLSRAQPAPTRAAPTAATDVAVGSNRPKQQDLDLPPLDSSDTFLHDLIAKLSQHPTLARLLATPGLVRGATLAVVQIGDGRTPITPMKVMRPQARLSISGASSGRIDPSNYVRWDGPTTALTSVSPADAVQLYVNVKPLFDQSYRELGNPDADFDKAIVKAIQILAATPRAPDDPVLLRRKDYFEHDDDTLRNLPPVQKQFLLLGSANRQKIIDWLRKFAEGLDLKIS